MTLSDLETLARDLRAHMAEATTILERFAAKLDAARVVDRSEALVSSGQPLRPLVNLETVTDAANLFLSRIHS